MARWKNRKKVGKVQGQQIILKANRSLFAHMIIISLNRDITIKAVSKHPLGPLSCSLANSGGSQRKTNTFARELENMSPTKDIPTPSACIIHAMSVVHKLKGDGKTFVPLTNSALNQAIYEGTDSVSNDIVFDVFRDTSIKNAELYNRGYTTGIQWEDTGLGHTILQWNKLIRTPESKKSVLDFLVKQ